MKDKINELAAANRAPERHNVLLVAFAVTVWRKNKSFTCFLRCFVKFNSKSLSASIENECMVMDVGEPTPA